jgi:O-antigen ligase
VIRTALLLFYIAVLVCYAPRNWFVSLCGAILLMAVVQHPDMPRNVAGIQGLNPWNVLLLSVVVSWLVHRSREGLVWDMPWHVTGMVVLYGAVVTVAFVRMIVDRRNLVDPPAFLISEHFINCLKWVVPGFILYDACRTRRRVMIASLVVLGVYLLLAIQVIRWMPLDYAMAGDALSNRASKIVQNEVGYNRVNMSMLLAGGSWALAAATLFFKDWRIKFGLLSCAAVVAFGQALTGGRTGYGTWAVIGVIFGVLRWRRALPAIPVVAALVLLTMPGVSERLLQGFGGRHGAIEVASNEYEITSGRNLIWPYVIEEIKKAPVLGYGRLAMNRLGVAQYLLEELGEDFPHPHNAYLEMLLDNGVVGLVLVMLFYVFVMWRSVVLFCNRSDAQSAAVGGMALALVLALLIAAVGSQTFYPREGAVGMWAAIGIMLRVSQERLRGRHTMPSGELHASERLRPPEILRPPVAARRRVAWSLTPAEVPRKRTGAVAFRYNRPAR